MNVPSPAPCHVNVAGVGKQSVWGLRIIACISVSTLTSFHKFVNTQKWWAYFRVANHALIQFDHNGRVLRRPA